MSTRWGIGGRCPPGSLVIGRVMGCSFVVVSVRALRGPQRKRILEKLRRQPSVDYLSMSVVLPVSSCAIPPPPVPASRRPRRKTFLGFLWLGRGGWSTGDPFAPSRGPRPQTCLTRHGEVS